MGQPKRRCGKPAPTQPWTAGPSRQGQWYKGESSEDSFRGFNHWIIAYQAWAGICLHRADFRVGTYEEKLAEAGMITLEARRRRGDLIQAYRTFQGVDNVDASQWFQMVQPRAGASEEHPGWTRNSSGTFNVMRGEGQNDFRRNFWSQRVTQPWNSLPKEVKEAESLNMFKNGIDNLIFKRHLANVRP